jgi:hypothetical protein
VYVALWARQHYYPPTTHTRLEETL